MADTPAAKGKKTATVRKATKAVAAAEPAKAKFARALDEAKAGAEQLRHDAQERAGAYREKATATGSEWIDEAKVMGSQAKERAWEMANEGKTRASDAIFSLGKIVDENATVIDEKIGPKYGEYARTAAQTMQDAAKKLDAKDMGELGEDAKEFVRKSPGIAVGLAAVAGFLMARMFRKSGD
jgi:ElaB/YqjD/DUF883 family membrane-anchored ribosome-binding protein